MRAVRKRVRRAETRWCETVCEMPDGVEPGSKMDRPDRVAALCSFLEDAAQEEFWVLLLDAKHRLCGLVRVSQGTLTASLVHPREVFGVALRECAAAVVCVHNHPSGDPRPSQEDVEVTHRLVEVGKTMGVPVLDHVIVGRGRHVSLRGLGRGGF